MMNNDKGRSDEFLRGIGAARGAERQRLHAALIDAARAIRAASDCGSADAALGARCESLLQRARAAADARTLLIAWSCLHQIERELAAALDDAQRRAALAAYRAEAAALGGWPRAAIDALAGEPGTVAARQALMRGVHGAREQRLYGLALARGQVGTLTVLLVAAVVFFSGWALAGGFEWILNDDVEVTLAMMIVNGVLFGFLGSLLSVVFGLLRGDAARGPDGLRGAWVTTVARAFVGAAVAIPIAFFLQSGLVNLNNVTPAFDLALCFAGGFSERWLARQFDLLGADPASRRAD